MEKKQKNRKNYIIYAIIILTGLLFTFLGCFILLKPIDEFIRNMLVAVTFCFVVVMSLAAGEKNSLLFDNFNYLGRFLISFLLGFVFVFISYFIPVKVWPILVLAVILTLTSNAVTGMLSYLFFIFLACYFKDASVYVFFMCVFVGVAGIALFQTLDKDYLISGPIFASLTILFVGETGFLILFENSRISLDTFVLPMLNVFVSLLILLIILRCYSKRIVHKYREQYQQINDPDFTLLNELKGKNEKEYYHAIHTAYLCDKIARKIGADYYLSRAGGYYHKIGILKGESVFKHTIEIAEKNKFPPMLLELLYECGDKYITVKKKESAIVILSDAVISSITFLLAKDNKAMIHYEQVIDIVFKQKMSGNLLAECELTLQELNEIRNLLIGEKLYYDFLR